jgi:hypothetical protein
MWKEAVLFRYSPGISLEVLGKTTESLDQECRCLSQDLNSGPHEAGRLNARPRRSARSSRNLHVEAGLRLCLRKEQRDAYIQVVVRCKTCLFAVPSSNMYRAIG